LNFIKIFGIGKLVCLAILYGVVCVILRFAIPMQYRLVTDRQTDRQTDKGHSIYHAIIASYGKNKSSAVSEMDDRLATICMGLQLGRGCAAFSEEGKRKRGSWVPI